jgi:riboflavin biosynthesis pyrimidine reductase
MLELGPVAGERSARAIVDGLGIADAAVDGRPVVAAVMIGSADGRAAVGGSSAPLGHPADGALLRELRTAVDAILVGTGTLLEGVALDPPAPLRLHDVHRADEHLFTHYVPAP